MIRTTLKTACFALALGLGAVGTHTAIAQAPLPAFKPFANPGIPAILPPEIAKQIQDDFDRHDAELKAMLERMPWGGRLPRGFGELKPFAFPEMKPFALPELEAKPFAGERCPHCGMPLNLPKGPSAVAPAQPALPDAPAAKEAWNIVPGGRVHVRTSDQAEGWSCENGKWSLTLSQNGCVLKAKGEVDDKNRPLFFKLTLEKDGQVQNFADVKELPEAYRKVLEEKLKEKLGAE